MNGGLKTHAIVLSDAFDSWDSSSTVSCLITDKKKALKASFATIMVIPERHTEHKHSDSRFTVSSILAHLDQPDRRRCSYRNGSGSRGSGRGGSGRGGSRGTRRISEHPPPLMVVMMTMVVVVVVVEREEGGRGLSRRSGGRGRG